MNQNSPIEYLFQSSNGFILAQGLKSVLEIMDSNCIGLNGVLYFTHQNSLKFGAKTLNLELIIAKIMERIVESGVKDIGSTQTLNFNNQLLIESFVILETRRDLEPKCVSELFLGQLLGRRGQLFERLSITFTSKGKREFVPHDRVLSLLVVYC